HNDYLLFRQRLEQVQAAGVQSLAAYVSLVPDAESLLPFMQQYSANHGAELTQPQFREMLPTLKQQLRLRSFANDLEQRRDGNLSVTMDLVDAMNPFDFELLLGMIYETQGYTFTPTPKSNDQGADVLLEKAAERIVIQAKLYFDAVGNKSVQEAAAARSHFACHRAKVVTNRTFTSSAIALAATNDVELVDREGLKQMLEQFNRCAKDYSKLAKLIKHSIAEQLQSAQPPDIEPPLP